MEQPPRQLICYYHTPYYMTCQAYLKTNKKALILGYFLTNPNLMKKFLLPFQNMVRADLFSGSLAVWSMRGGAAQFAPPHPSRALRGEDRIPFELFLKYTARQDFASQRNPPRFARRLVCMGFWAKRKRIYQ